MPQIDTVKKDYFESQLLNMRTEVQSMKHEISKTKTQNAMLITHLQSKNKFIDEIIKQSYKFNQQNPGQITVA
jgi:hypothetical protein